MIMPILWRHLLRSYFQVFALCIVGFIAILLVMRFQEVARFASSGANHTAILLFTLYQVPYILVYAIPISCLIAAILLFQKMSHTHELTALRASGLGLKSITYPLILAGSLLAILNFTIASELTPRCRSLSKELVYRMTAVNPLLLFQKDTMVRLKDAYFDMKVLKSNKYAKDFIFIVKNHTNERLSLMTAKEISLEGEMLNGQHVTFISSVDTKRPDDFDHLVIENQTSMCTKASSLSQFMQNSDWHSSYDYYPLKMILAKEVLDQGKKDCSITHAKLEIARRLSIGLAAFTFTFIGVTYGIGIGRHRSKKGVLWALGLSAFFLVCFTSAKSLRHSPTGAMFLYLLPHPLLILLSTRSLKQISYGIE